MARDLDACRAAAPLWAITSYYNPARYRRRLVNYRVFRRHLRLPLLAVELTFDGPPDLEAADADILIQRSGGAVLWQKERLLNLALAALPASCRAVAWLDCDTVIAAANWPDRVCRALEDAPLVQPFTQAVHAAADALIGPEGTADRVIAVEPSLPAALAAGRSLAACVQGEAGSTVAKGLAWVARRDLLDAHGWYDRCIVGGGPLALACAAHGQPDVAVGHMRMNDRQRDDYLAWAGPFFAAVRGNVGRLDATVLHLWHGDRSDRRYAARYADLAAFAFEPRQDIALTNTGVWRWASDKPRLHAYVRSYFAARREDG